MWLLMKWKCCHKITPGSEQKANLPCDRFRQRGNVLIPRCDRDAHHGELSPIFMVFDSKKMPGRIFIVAPKIRQQWVLAVLKWTKFWRVPILDS